MEQLDREARLKLMKFVCSFAWTDLRVSPAERDLVQRMIGRLRLDGDARRQIEAWLEVPPRPEEVDPTTVPMEHRRVFLDAARAVVESDGRVSPGERDALSLFQELLRTPPRA